MSRRTALKVTAGIAVSFAVLAGTIILLAQLGIFSFALAKLMLAGLLALYFGIGFLVVVYRFIDKLN
jgi:hypothetical protein